MLFRWLAMRLAPHDRRSLQPRAARRRPLNVELLETRCTPTLQFASSVLDYSSQFSDQGWSATQALGAPDTFEYGDLATAWTAAFENGTTEFLYLGFTTPVYARGAVIRETYGNGFVRRIDLVDVTDTPHTVWQGTDPSLPGSPANFAVSWPLTDYLTAGMVIYVDTNHSASWEEIDSVQLDGEPLLAVYASSVLGFSSQFSTPQWSAQQALGAPDTFAYGDFATAWAPSSMNGAAEFLSLGFATPLYAHGVTIRESNGNGFVTRVDVLDLNGQAHVVWTGTDPSLPGLPADFEVTFPATGFLVAGVTIHVNTNHDLGTWEEIDAVQLLGTAQPLVLLTDLNDLPATGVRSGSVLSGVLTSLQTRLKAAATAQTAMAKQLKKIGLIVPSATAELKSLASSLAAIAKQLAKLNSGKTASVLLAPDVVMDRDALDLIERYLKYLFVHAESAESSLRSTARAASAAAQDAGLDPKKLIPGYETYESAKKWADATGRKINGAIDAVKNAPNKAIQWLAGLLGRSAETQARAQQEAKLVAEHGTAAADRVDELSQQLAPQTIADKLTELDFLTTGTPPVFALASARLKALMGKTRDSAQSLRDQVIDLAAWSRNQALVGHWLGTVQRPDDGRQGDLRIYFKKTSAGGDTISGTLSHTFYEGNKVSRTTGNFTGALDAQNVFRGTVTVKNSSGTGTYTVAWLYDGVSFQGTLYEGEGIFFGVQRK